MIEMRWLQVPAGRWHGAAVGFYDESTRTVRHLQFREVIETAQDANGKPYVSIATSWKDVPSVESAND